MINDVDQLGGRRQGFSPDHVIDLILADEAKAYYFNDAIRAGVINDALGEVLVVIWAPGEIFHTYIRSAGGEALTFRLEGDRLVDEKTGSTWDPNRGMATEGPLMGEILQPVPSLSSFDWAWKDFYPESEFYVPENSSGIGSAGLTAGEIISPGERHVQIRRFVELFKFRVGHNYY